MKILKSFAFVAVVTVLTCFGAVESAQAQYTYQDHGDGTCTITGYSGQASGALTIPDFINGLEVVSIGVNAFRFQESMTSVNVPNTVTNIGSGAFYGCQDLKSAILPNSVISIGDFAFENCVFLTGITLPIHITSIGEGTFASCFSLTSVALPSGLTDIGDAAFGDCTGLTNIVFPNSVITIEDQAFEGAGLTKIIVPDSVTSIGSGAFGPCPNATVAAIGNGVTNIGDKAFFDNPNITSVVIGRSVTSLGDQVFGACPGLISAYFLGNAPSDLGTTFWQDSHTTAYYLPGTTGWGSTFGGAPAQLFPFNLSVTNETVSVTGYSGSSGLVVIPANLGSLPIVSIGPSAFYGVDLTNVVIPASVTSVGSAAFGNCPSLTAAYFLGNGPPDLGNVFSGDSSATAYYFSGATGWSSTFGGAPTAVYPFSFALNNGVITITGFSGGEVTANIPASIVGLPVTSIGTNAFYLNDMTGVTIPDTITNIGDFAFHDCGNLESVTIPNSVGSIGNDAFLGSTLRNGVTIPDSVASIGSSAFADTYLSGVTIPASVTNIGDGPFNNCLFLTAITVDPANSFYSSLNGVLFNKNQTTLIQFGAGGAGSYAIPNSVTTVGTEALYGCTSLTNIVIPNSVTTIGDAAIGSCYGLTSITIPGSVISIGIGAFQTCLNLNSALFQGNAPAGRLGSDNAFEACHNTVYYLNGTTGWGSTYGTRPTAVFVQPGFDYIAANGAITITGYTGAGGEVIIPATIGGLPVESIGTLAFSNCTSVTSIDIPSSITSIGDDAFAGCTSLTSALFLGNAPPDLGDAYSGDSNVTVYYLSGSGGWGSTFGGAPTALYPYAFTVNNNAITITGYYSSDPTAVIPDIISGMPVISIGNNAFNSDSVTNITIPASVTSIGDGAFANCAGLGGITIPNSITNMGNYVFQNCTSLGAATISTNVPSIGIQTFYNCSNLASVTIPASVVTIGDYAFSGSGLINATIPDNVTNVGNDAYFDCSSLTNVEVGSGIRGIGVLAFANCINLLAINETNYNANFFSLNGVLFDDSALFEFPGGVGGTYAVPPFITSVANSAFAYCAGLTNVTMGNNITSVGDGAFYNCSGLITINISLSMTSIGNGVFQSCTSLAGITIPNNITSIGNSAFAGSGLTSVTIPDSVTSLGDGAFNSCGSLASVTIGSGVTSMGNGEFQSCGSLRGITIPGTITSIGNSAFAGSGLTSVTIPDSVTSLGDGAFNSCGSLASVTIGSGVTSMGNGEFQSCGSLRGITIPGTITSIGNNAFAGSGLTSITIPDSVTSIGQSAFDTCGNLASVIIGNGVATIGDYAFQNCQNLANVIMGNSVTRIGNFSFFGCGMANIVIPASLNSIGDFAFGSCYNLVYALFEGNAPPDTQDEFDSDNNVVYYLSGSSGWNSSFGEVQTQLYPFNISLNNGAFTITGNNGVSGAVAIPAAIGGIPVTSIGPSAFYGASITSVTIPASVSSVGDQAFASETSLTSALFQGNAPPDVGTAFSGDTSAIVYYLSGTAGWGPTFGGAPTQLLVQPGFNYTANNGVIIITAYTGSNSLVVIPDNIGGLPVTGIGATAFYRDASLVGVSIPNSVTNVGSQAFASCSSLISALFECNAPPDVGTAFSGDSSVSVYYLRFTTGWGSTFGGVAAVQEPFDYQVNNGAITVSAYFGSGGVLAIPSVIGGLPVNGLGSYMYFNEASVTNITIPEGITNIGTAPFQNAVLLTTITLDPANAFFSSINGVLFDKNHDTLLEFPAGVGGSYTIPASVTAIANSAFGDCTNLTGVTISDSVTNIGEEAFINCSGLTYVTIPANVNTIVDYAFSGCSSLSAALFTGNAPPDLGDAFNGDTNIVYYLAGTTGWGPTFGGVPTALWNPQAASLGTAGGQFGFNITGPTNAVVIVEACTNLANPVWLPVSTNTVANGVSAFSDPQSKKYPFRFYRFSYPQ